MTTSRTVVFDAPGGPEVMKIVERPVGDPGPGEVRIRHHACGLNYIDIYQRSGVYPLVLQHALGIRLIGTAGSDEKCVLANAYGHFHQTVRVH